MIAAVVLLALGRPAVSQGCVGTLGPCFQALGFLAPVDRSRDSFALAISPDGSIVAGQNLDSSGVVEAFRWTAGTMSGLGFPGCASGCNSYVGGVNQQGVISGYVGNSPGPPYQPYTWLNGVATPLGLLPGGTGAFVFGIGAQANVIAGSGDPGLTAIVWRNGVATALSNLSTATPYSSAQGVSGDGRVVVGGSTYDANNLSRAVTWQGNTITPLPFLNAGDNESFAGAANADGSVIVGQSEHLNMSSAAVRWVNGIPSSLGAPDRASPTSVSANGLVVAGYSIDSSSEAFRWTPADGYQNFQLLLNAAGVSTTGWNLNDATSFVVSGNGTTFAGTGLDSDHRFQAFIARVPLPASLVTMHTHDFSGEGKSDLLWKGPPSGDASFPVAVWTMNGAQVVQSAGIGVFPANLAIIGQLDFNGDGYADILWRDSSGNLSIWFMNGTQVSSTVAVGNVPNNWAVYGTGDLNGDGKGDLLWRDRATGAVSVWFMDGGNVLATANFGAVPSSWTIIADDNRGDILWQDSSGNIAIWQINGTQIVQSAGLGNPGSGWSFSGIGDFNGDGFIDILWRNGNSWSSASGAVSIWFSNVNQAQNNSPYIAYTTSLGSVPTNFNIVQTGDYNGDGASDILWRDNQGNFSIWFLAACGNVACVSSSAGVGNVGGWTLQALNAE
jgi:probable HAF family extracellular repeat protein